MDLHETPTMNGWKQPNRMRSLLFVPGDSERKIAKATSVGADALILDLEDSVASDAKSVARKQLQIY